MGHVTEAQRYTIAVLLKQKIRQTEIADLLGKCKSVISREIKRNSNPRTGKYSEKYAQKAYLKRQRLKKKAYKLTSPIRVYIEAKLSEYWSPEQISKTEHPLEEEMVSVQTIYNYINKNRQTGGYLYKLLRRQRRYRRLAGNQEKSKQIKNRLNIKERPKEANERTRFGDFEVDLILGSQKSGAILTINDRKTGLAKLRLVKTKTTKEVGDAIIKALHSMKSKCLTITSDNGMEFTCHRKIARRLEVDYFFCDPYCSWQRGSNENLNGLIRQFFRKGSSFNNITSEELKRIEKLLNNRPRKRYNFRSPNQEFDLLTKVAFNG